MLGFGLRFLIAIGEQQNPVVEEVLVAAEEAVISAEVVEKGAFQIPECPKRNIPMVQRTAARLRHLDIHLFQFVDRPHSLFLRKI